MPTADLAPGTYIERANGAPAVVIAVNKTERTAPTFNLEVADFHSYFVGETRAWVHNIDCIGPRQLYNAATRATDSEIEVALVLSKQGRGSVVLRDAIDNVKDLGTSDLLIDGLRYDIFTPTTRNADRIIGAIAKKNSQASGVVLDLRKNPVPDSELRDIVRRVRGTLERQGKKSNIEDVIVLR